MQARLHQVFQMCETVSNISRLNFANKRLGRLVSLCEHAEKTADANIDDLCPSTKSERRICTLLEKLKASNECLPIL